MDRNRVAGVGSAASSRPSGIRPPSTKKISHRNTQPFRPSDAMPSSSSSRKTNHNLFTNFPGSGGSRASGVGGGSGGRVSVFGGFRSTFASSARKSNVTAKMGPLFGTTPQHNRPSFQPNTGSSVQSSRRGSSIGGSRHVKENRPLSETSFHRQCATKLIAFLTENGYPNPINKRLSSHPTVQDITKIFEFMFSFYDIKCKITPIDTEIPKIMSLLEYPFPVKKSDLVSFTNGRALGSVLGMLEWLVDSLTYSFNMDPERTFYPNFDGEIDSRYELIKLCLSSAEASDNQDIDEHIENQLRELLVKTYGTEEDYGELIDEQEKLEQDIQRLDDEITHIRDLPTTIQTYQSDIHSYENYIIEMQEHNRANEETLDHLEKELIDKSSTLKKLADQTKALKCQINEQEFGVEEAELARDRKQQLDDEIKQEVVIIEEIKKSIRATKLEISKYEDILKKMCSDSDSYINAMIDLVNSPIMSSFTRNLREYLNTDEWKQILDSLQNSSNQTNETHINELENLFSTKVHELKIAIVEQLSSLQGSIALTEQQKLNELNLQIEEKETQLTNNDKQVKALMAEMENCRKEQVSQLALLQSEVDTNRQLLSEFETNSKRSHKEVKQTILELRKRVEEKENCYRKEYEDTIQKWNYLITNNKKGIEGFTSMLDQFNTEESTTGMRLKSILAKSSSVITRQKAKRNQMAGDH